MVLTFSGWLLSPETADLSVLTDTFKETRHSSVHKPPQLKSKCWGLNERSSIVSQYFPLGDAVWEGLGDMTFLKEGCHWRWALRLKALRHFQLVLSALLLWSRMWVLGVLFPPSCLPLASWLSWTLSGTLSPEEPSSISGLITMLTTQQKSSR